MYMCPDVNLVVVVMIKMVVKFDRLETNAWPKWFEN